MTIASVQSVGARRPLTSPPRLLVTHRDHKTHRYRAVGFLEYDGGVYSFVYLRRAVDASDFRPLPGFSDVHRRYTSARLFPLFSERVISSRRPDRRLSLDALGLGEEAAPFEILSRNGGIRMGDMIEVLPAPTAPPGNVLAVDFLVHGVRHQPVESQERISSLRVGEHLRVVPERDNVWNPRALLVTDDDEMRLGYVPDPLLDLVHSLSDRTMTVLRANGPEVGFHFRLLVRVAGQVIVGRQPFDGSDWETVA